MGKTYEKNMADTVLVVKGLKVLEKIDGGGIKEIKNTVESVKRQTTAQAKQQEEYWKSLSDDGVITVIEKQTLYRETQNIARSYAAITQQAAALQITAALLNDFVRTYEALHTYLYTTLKVFDDMSSETMLDDRDTFNTYFSNYYFEENFVLIAITAGILDTLEFRVLESLTEPGEEGETAIYKGGLYQYVNGAWKSVTTGAYKGPRNELPGDEEDSFFIASESFTLTEGLIVNGEELYVNGEALGITHTYLKGLIYYCQDGVWLPENDKTNWRYAAAFADVINITGELPQIFQDAIDDLQDQIDTKANATSLQQEIQDRQGQYTIVAGDIVRIDNDINGIINRVTGTETDINNILSDIDGEGGIVEQITDIANDIDGTNGIKDQLTNIAGNISDITDDIDALDGTVDGVISDVAGHTTELATQAAALREQAQELTDLADEVDDKATKTALNTLANQLTQRADAIDQAITGIQQRLTASETAINGILSDINGEGGIVDQITDIADDIDGSNGIKDQLTNIADNISDITDDIDALDGTLDGVVTDVAGHTTELATQADALQAQATALENLASEVDDKATQDALNSLATELRNRATAIENTIESVQQALAGKISHLPVYFGARTTVPPNPQEGDFYLFTGTGTDNSKIKRYTNGSWETLDPTISANRNYYMMALEDILAANNPASGYFSALFAQAFFTACADITTLDVKTIYLRQTGAIQSANAVYTVQQVGFRLDADGNIDANGNMHFGANSTNKVAIGVDLYNSQHQFMPDFNDFDVVIGGRTKIKGKLDGAVINCGSLHVEDKTVTANVMKFSVGSSIWDLWHALKDLGFDATTRNVSSVITGYDTVSMKYGDTTIQTVRVYEFGTGFNKEQRITFNGDIELYYWDQEIDPPTLEYVTTINVAKTISLALQLSNLLDVKPNENGVVYIGPDNTLKIS